MRHLGPEPLDHDAIVERVHDAECGAVASFIGTVRPDEGTVAIEYSSYEGMAERELDAILKESNGRWPDARVEVAHRIGRVPAGEASVIVVAAAPHRDNAFAACRYVIEELKARVPIWKREERGDGSGVWVDHRGGRVVEAPPSRPD